MGLFSYYDRPKHKNQKHGIVYGSITLKFFCELSIPIRITYLGTRVELKKKLFAEHPTVKPFLDGKLVETFVPANNQQQRSDEKSFRLDDALL